MILAVAVLLLILEIIEMTTPGARIGDVAGVVLALFLVVFVAASR